MKMSTMFPSKFLKGTDLNGTPTVAIKSVALETVGQDGEQKHVVYFEGMQKGMVLNKTNADLIESLYGDETNDWLGQEVTLFSMPVAFNGKTTMSCRVRAPKKVQTAQIKEAVQDEIPY
jgi:hypothetical protein